METTIKKIEIESVNNFPVTSDENKRVVITKESKNTFDEHVSIADIKRRIAQREIQKTNLDEATQKDLDLINQIVSETGLKTSQDVVDAVIK